MSLGTGEGTRASPIESAVDQSLLRRLEIERQLSVDTTRGIVTDKTVMLPEREPKPLVSQVFPTVMLPEREPKPLVSQVFPTVIASPDQTPAVYFTQGTGTSNARWRIDAGKGKGMAGIYQPAMMIPQTAPTTQLYSSQSTMR